MQHRLHAVSTPVHCLIALGVLCAVGALATQAAAETPEPPAHDRWQALPQEDAAAVPTPDWPTGAPVSPPGEGDVLRRTFSLAQGGAADSAAAQPDLMHEERDTFGSGIAVGAHVSTLGFGPSVAIPLNDYFVVTVSGNYFAFDRDDKYSDVRYNVDVELMSAGGTLDWHAFGGPFFISGGVYWNGNELEFDATPAGPIEFGGLILTPAQAGRIDGEVEFNEVAPYLGIGFDNTQSSGGRLSFYGSIGAFYQGKPDVDLSVSGTATGLPGFAAALDREIDDIEDDVEDFVQFYPVVTLGLRWRF